MEGLKVKKRDGSLEPWSFDKLVASIGKAGVETSEADKISKDLFKWVQDSAEEGVIASTAIRDELIEKMKVDFPVEAENYRAYKKE